MKCPHCQQKVKVTIAVQVKGPRYPMVGICQACGRTSIQTDEWEPFTRLENVVAKSAEEFAIIRERMQAIEKC